VAHLLSRQVQLELAVEMIGLFGMGWFPGQDGTELAGHLPSGFPRRHSGWEGGSKCGAYAAFHCETQPFYAASDTE
jgi:hypothetical protein